MKISLNDLRVSTNNSASSRSAQDLIHELNDRRTSQQSVRYNPMASQMKFEMPSRPEPLFPDRQQIMASSIHDELNERL